MLELNLIREKLAQRENRKRFFRYFRMWYLFSILVLLFFLARFGFTASKIAADRRLLADIQTDIDRNKNRFEIDKLEKEWMGYFRDVGLIERIVDNRTSWTGMLKELAALIPPGMSLARISTDGIPDKNRFVIEVVLVPKEKQQGFALTDNFIGTLEKSAFFGAGVKLEAHERLNNSNGQDSELFKISVPMAQR